MTNSIDEVADAKCILLIGSNLSTSHPIIELEVKKAVRKGAKLIVVNPRKIDLCQWGSWAHLWLRLLPGTDVALLNGMMHVILKEGLENKAFIQERTEGFEELRKSLEDFDLEEAARITGVPAEEIAEAARLYATSESSSILYTLGITEHVHGTENVWAIANLAMLTGQIGKPSSGVNPLRGANNVQGVCDVGCLPEYLPGYQNPEDPAAIARLEREWGSQVPGKVGLSLVEMFAAAETGRVKAMYIVGENPALSEPDADHARKALSNLDFLIVQDLFLSETAQFAHVVLPGASFAEKDGTFTNTERRIQRVRRAIDPIGDSRPDWLITCQMAQALGARGFDFTSPDQIMEEIARVTHMYGGISYPRLEGQGLQWPCPTPEHPGTRFLHKDRFSRGLGRFIPVTHRGPEELPDQEYPLVLTTGRSRFHFHTGTMTRRVRGLSQLHPEETVELSPQDAQALGLKDGDTVRVQSRRGEVTAKARITDRSQPGVVFMTFHFWESVTNVLTNPSMDPVCKTPELKVCAVRVSKA
jgi:formate dehydrogenase alpha subunit